MLIFDDGVTTDIEESTQIVIHANGNSKNLDIDFHCVRANAKTSKDDVNTQLGSIIIMNALKTGFDDSVIVDASILLEGEADRKSVV